VLGCRRGQRCCRSAKRSRYSGSWTTTTRRGDDVVVRTTRGCCGADREAVRRDAWTMTRSSGDVVELVGGGVEERW
jgi:hypothetical protein